MNDTSTSNRYLDAHYAKVRRHVFTQRPLSRERQLLIGALFSGEYALESAALFNPSIVPHPDQSGVPAGGLRFIMSLRATGEGHISSIEFRTGNIAPDGSITLDPVSRFVDYAGNRLQSQLSEEALHHQAARDGR